ncbi:hypothetical protein GLAREA_02477 [Glarea lozoyensis ATCC 20868]|uniref:Uncharacterized protein n=1 Tax=Glarea lozoyensis (strain ATCC 20868 / MF5171) TaxID=1116229 RepID=S3CMX3_GLAL2|nr:uncharacterized protein GLAREA_02477 [Glarea lozoyensis ATCC 20868]EPE26564.1 hypothetical protein GLAREA_02477 [Glarea lozoyensis ATCC 20868]
MPQPLTTLPPPQKSEISRISIYPHEMLCLRRLLIDEDIITPDGEDAINFTYFIKWEHCYAKFKAICPGYTFKEVYEHFCGNPEFYRQCRSGYLEGIEGGMRGLGMNEEGEEGREEGRRKMRAGNLVE